MSTTYLFPQFLPFTAGESKFAKYLDDKIQESARILLQPASLSDGRDRVLEDLAAQLELCVEPGWDGYAAEPVDPQTVYIASAFVKALPYRSPMPTVGSEPDGHITLEWYRTPSWVLSVSISPEANVYYAAILGNSKVNGIEPFVGQVPNSVLQIISRFAKK